MDVLTRRKRSRATRRVDCPAGITTASRRRTVVRSQARRDEGKSKTRTRAREFSPRWWAWKEESGATILGQMRRIGDSGHWTRERFTIDEGLSPGVRTIFKKLYDDTDLPGRNDHNGVPLVSNSRE